MTDTGDETRSRNIPENKRAYNAISKVIRFARSDSGPIAQAVRIILNEFYDEIPDPVITEAAKTAGVASTYMTTRVATQLTLVNVISRKLTSEIATKVVARGLTRIGVGFSISASIVQRVLENASQSSQRQMVSVSVLIRFFSIERAGVLSRLKLYTDK